jgi:sulfur carrier protein
MTHEGSSSFAASTQISIFVNGENEVISARTITELLSEKGFLEYRGIAVALNGYVVRRCAWEQTSVGVGDKIEIVHARQGG